MNARGRMVQDEARGKQYVKFVKLIKLQVKSNQQYGWLTWVGPTEANSSVVVSAERPAVASASAMAEHTSV